MGFLENQMAAEQVDQVYMDLEAQLMQNIARHLSDWKQPIDTDRWLMQKLAEIGKLNQENIKLIAQMSGISQTAAERMLNELAEDTVKQVDPGLRQMVRDNLSGEMVAADKSESVKQTVAAMKQQAKDTLNMCNTTMLYKARDAYSSLVQKIASTAKEVENKQEFVNVLNRYGENVTAGVESRQQAVRKCIREFNEKGIPAFVDKRGRSWTPEAYVNMAMRNTARQTAEEVQTARCKDAGVNLIQIDSHSGARPKCAKDQGKIFSLDNTSGEVEDLNGRKIRYYPWSSSSYGDPDGILGINCRHHKWPFIPGVSIQRYFPTEDFEENDRLYKETQAQRALERDVRKQKRECMLYDEIGDKDAFEEAAVKLKSKEAALKNYVDSKPELHRRRDREQVVGFDQTISAESRKTAERHYKDWSKSIGASKKNGGPKNLAEYYNLKYNDDEEGKLYKGYVKAVNTDKISPLIGYDQYKDIYNRAKSELIGLETKDGRKVENVTIHLTDRIIGTHEWLSPDASADTKRRLNHKSAQITDVKDALVNPVKIGKVTERKNPYTGEIEESVLYCGNRANVSYNITTRTVIQAEGT